MSNANSGLRDRAIRQALAIQGYGRGLAQDIVRLLNGADAALMDKLTTRLLAIEEQGFDSSPATTARITALLQEVRAINGTTYDQVGQQLTADLEEFAHTQAQFQQGTLDAALQTPGLTSLPSPAVLHTLVTQSPIQGSLLSSWIDTAENNRADRIESAIRQGILEGQSTSSMVRTIRGTKAAQRQL